MVCRQYMGFPRGDCGKPAVWRVYLPARIVYKCARHAGVYRRSGLRMERVDE